MMFFRNVVFGADEQFAILNNYIWDYGETIFFWTKAPMDLCLKPLCWDKYDIQGLKKKKW